MATGGGDNTVTLLVTYSGQKLSLTIPTNAKVGDVIHKAVEGLKLKREDLPLSLLYQGSPLPDDAPVEVALSKLKGVTAIHLVKRSNPNKGTTTRIHLGQRGKLHAFCSTCEGLSGVRPIFKCKSCKVEGQFERASMEPLDHFHGDYTKDQLVGTCNACKKTDVPPIVLFQCVSCESKDVAPLRQIRDNVHNVPCMKCGLKKELVLQMRCSSQHCMCLDCFKNMCKVKLGSGGFKNFDEFGYSVPCPGPGDDCKDTPILDPHHFKIVDDDVTDAAFYKKFKDEAVAHYEPPGDDILCLCKKEIALSSAVKVKVKEEARAEEPAVSGGKWYSSWLSIFKKKQQQAAAPPPPPRTRRRANCTECNRQYCMECKMIWHEGSCTVVDNQELQRQEFPITPDMAMSARWPSSS